MIPETLAMKKVNKVLITISCFVLCFHPVLGESNQPDGNFAFDTAPIGDLPPQVRKPPYVQSGIACPALDHQPLDLGENFCGDLNKGVIPLNPIGQRPDGEIYPFKLFRNKTLEFLRNSLPFLKNDDRLPKVVKYIGPSPPINFDKRFGRSLRNRRQNEVYMYIHPGMNDNQVKIAIHNVSSLNDIRGTPRAVAEGREMCSDSSNMLCRLFGMFSGLPSLSGQQPGPNRNGLGSNRLDGSGPPTPCPSVAEYATPLFAKNYQGIWRYVIQIPHEEYFTQTVEITKCLQGKCKYLEGACLTSSRWVSLLAAEVFYPNSFAPSLPPPPRPSTPPAHFDAPIPPVYDFQNFQQYLNTRAGVQASHRTKPASGNVDIFRSTPATIVCDGYDQQGCFQVRMFYDWFLVPGACKCWRPHARSLFVHQ